MKTQAKAKSAVASALVDEMRADAKPSEDKLDQARIVLAQLRDLELEQVELEERLKTIAETVKLTKEKTIVDMFDEAGINRLGLPADGNLPPYEIEIADFYKANIPAETKDEAFDYLRKVGSEDLIKSTFTIEFGLREAKQTERFQRSLDKAGIDYSLKQGVPWNTLTAWFKTEHKKKPLTVKAMALLGAVTGRVAKVVKQKEGK